MSRTLSTIALAAAVALAATTIPGCVVVADEGLFSVHNHSSYGLTEIRLAHPDDSTWGKNLLLFPLHPGQTVTIDLGCRRHDVMVVDQRGVTCVRTDVQACFSDEAWVIDDGTLATCAMP